MFLRGLSSLSQAGAMLSEQVFRGLAARDHDVAQVLFAAPVALEPNVEYTISQHTAQTTVRVCVNVCMHVCVCVFVCV